MLKCQKIIELASTQLDAKGSLFQRLEMRLHLLMCKTCSRYVHQLGFMQKLAVNMDKHHEKITLSATARQRIQKKIQQTHDTQNK